MDISVLAIAGSPRRHGNSEDLLDYVIGYLSGHPGIVVEKIILSKIEVNPCRGCNACEKEGICVINDDMKMLEDKITGADVIIFSSPIFCMGLCAQVKALIDRMQVFRSRRYVLKQPIIPTEKRGKSWPFHLNRGAGLGLGIRRGDPLRKMLLPSRGDQGQGHVLPYDK